MTMNRPELRSKDRRDSKDIVERCDLLCNESLPEGNLEDGNNTCIRHFQKRLDYGVSRIRVSRSVLVDQDEKFNVK